MIQPLHIARKDARHLWPETLTSLVLLAAYAYMSSKSWPTSEVFDPSPFVTGLLGFLIPVSWLVLISRLVHDEELVGDRQFWTTRPYTWYGLLSAKLFYLAAAVLLPFAIMQAWMLHHAGLYPTHDLAGIFTRVVFVTLVVLLPLIAIAAVTATFVRYMTSALVGLVYLLTVVIFTAYKFGEKMAVPYLDWPFAIVIVGMMVAAVLVQYILRKTLIARLLLVATPLVMVLLTALAPADTLIAHRYPDTAPGTLTFAPGIVPPQAPGAVMIVRDKVLLQLPALLNLNDAKDLAFTAAQSLRVTLDGPGVHYVSSWTPAARELFGKATILPFTLPADIYDKVHDKPVALHLELGTQAFTLAKPYTVTATEKAFPVPGNGMCKLQDGAMNCTFPFQVAETGNIAATIHSGECATPGPQTAVAHGTLQQPRGIPGISPVVVASASMGIGQQAVSLCPGTPVTFTTATPGAYGRMYLDIPAITLEPYVQHIRTKGEASQPQPAETDQ